LTPRGYTEEIVSVKEAFKEAIWVIVKEYIPQIAMPHRRLTRAYVQVSKV
jgi:hypothetical protein